MKTTVRSNAYQEYVAYEKTNYRTNNTSVLTGYVGGLCLFNPTPSREDWDSIYISDYRNAVTSL